MTRLVLIPGAPLRRLAACGAVLPLALATLLCAAQQKRKPSRPGEVEVVQVSAQRAQGLLAIDGLVRNCGERSIQGLTLVFHLMAPGREVVTSQKGAIEEQVLEPGAEAEFHWQLRDPVRAVSVQIQATDGSGQELPVRKPGPYPVE